jgi:hypothetical protein
MLAAKRFSYLALKDSLSDKPNDNQLSFLYGIVNNRHFVSLIHVTLFLVQTGVINILSGDHSTVHKPPFNIHCQIPRTSNPSRSHFLSQHNKFITDIMTEIPSSDHLYDARQLFGEGTLVR